MVTIKDKKEVLDNIPRFCKWCDNIYRIINIDLDSPVKVTIKIPTKSGYENQVLPVTAIEFIDE